MTAIPGLIPADRWPVVPRDMHSQALAENARLTVENLQLRQRVAALEAETARLRRYEAAISVLAARAPEVRRLVERQPLT